MSANISLTSGDVGLGNVPNVDTSNASNITSGTLDKMRINLPMISYDDRLVVGRTSDGIYTFNTDGIVLSGCYTYNLTNATYLYDIVNNSPFASDKTAVRIIRIHPTGGSTLQFRDSASASYTSSFGATFYGQTITSTWYTQGCTYIVSTTMANAQKWTYTSAWQVKYSGSALIEEVRVRV